MQEKFGNFWKKTVSSNKKLWIVIIMLVSLLLCFGLSYLYLYAVQPLRAWVTSNNDNVPVHDGLQFYTEKSYKDYAHADLFDQIISELDYVSDGEIINFYHCENEHFDNPVHGKRRDIFSIDIQLDSAKYTEYKKKIDETAVYLTYQGDFDLYLSDYGEEHVVVTAVRYDQNIIRVIFMPDIDDAAEKMANGEIINSWYFDMLNNYLIFDYPPEWDYSPEYRKAGT